MEAGRYDSLHGDEDIIDSDYQRRHEEKLEADANEDDWRDYE